ncbi:MAG TPA: hypothetical protein VE988_02085 [Gemmataceae bacterium]|nr:hypothetical protein [Gemmataceae bacterium]
MNCQKCQQRLMSTERPEFPDLKVQAHLAICAACREFQRNVAKLEANVQRIPIPPTDAKARLVREILGQPALPLPKPRILRAPPSGTPHTVPLRQWLRRAQWTGAAAAAVVLIGCGIWFGMWLARTNTPDGTVPPDVAKGPEQTSKPPQSVDPFGKKGTSKNKKPGKKDDNIAPPVLADATPLLAKLMACDLKLAEAETTGDKVKALAELADALQMETQMLSKSAPPAELNKLAGFFKKVIDDGIVARAKELPMGERVEVLKDVAAQLTKTTNETALLAQSSPKSAEALRTISSAARDGDAILQKLMQEAAE